MSARNREQPEVAEAPPVEAASSNTVEISGAGGEPLGFTITHKGEIAELEREPDETDARLRLRRLAKSLSGWSTFYLDGEKLTFSQARAVTFFTRFPHIAAQVERAISKDEK